MPRGKTPLSGTNENLKKYAVPPVARWLIDAAKGDDTLTYSEAKLFLSQDHGFGTIFPTRLGFVAGDLMERIHAKEPDAPLLNMLLVNQADRYPGEGVCSFMADYFDESWLANKSNRKRRWNKWREYADYAMQEAYAYKRWDEVYRKVFEEELVEDGPFHQDPAEADGKPGGRAGGEGPNHRALRLWVMKNPDKITPRLKILKSVTEFELPSADRVDVVYLADDKSVVIEVKSRDSNHLDLKRGVYQCIKYRAVKEAADGRKKADILAILVTEGPLPGDLEALAKLHRIRHVEVPRSRRA